MNNLGNRFVFPAPTPSYTATSYKRHLCWIPWSKVISPSKAAERSDGIPCLWFPAPKAAIVLLFFHANAEDLGMCFQVLKHMRDQFKVNVLSVEYPGYGLLHDLSPSEDGVYEVAVTALRFLVDEIGTRYSQIFLFGRSLGSGPAVYLASQFPVGGLILVSPFSSIKAAVQSIAGQVLAWPFAERFPNVKAISNVSCPTLFIHGDSDTLIPSEHSLRLWTKCRARKLLITPPKMEHNSNLFSDASFLAVPAIHFFGFPGYYTSAPPRLPAHLFEAPRKRLPLRERVKEEPSGCRAWMCDCMSNGDVPQLEMNFRARQEQHPDDITRRLLQDDVCLAPPVGWPSPGQFAGAPPADAAELAAARTGQGGETADPENAEPPACCAAPELLPGEPRSPVADADAARVRAAGAPPAAARAEGAAVGAATCAAPAAEPHVCAEAGEGAPATAASAEAAAGAAVPTGQAQVRPHADGGRGGAGSLAAAALATTAAPPAAAPARPEPDAEGATDAPPSLDSLSPAASAKGAAAEA